MLIIFKGVFANFIFPSDFESEQPVLLTQNESTKTGHFDSFYSIASKMYVKIPLNYMKISL